MAGFEQFGQQAATLDFPMMLSRTQDRRVDRKLSGQEPVMHVRGASVEAVLFCPGCSSSGQWTEGSITEVGL